VSFSAHNNLNIFVYSKKVEMTTDRNIQVQIQKGIESNGELHGTKIDVAVRDGQAFLSGQVDKYCKKDIARKIAKDVEGVLSINEAILVMLGPNGKIPDDEIKASVIEKFKKNFGVAHKEIKVIVKDGSVWLEGQLKWKYQKELAGECIGCIDGIKQIENSIVVPQSIGQTIAEKDILAAIYGDRSITTDIKVEILGRRIVLKGTVEDVNQKNLVTRLVRTVPGVSEIENFLAVKSL